ncbi:MAG: acyl-CoA thioesterase [Alphaproteobacteria bacterium]|nr:acyl-CoA thioesterase [Alphaproteobacteria bacterium]
MWKPTDAPVNSPVFSHEIRVTWGDCDPAQIAYTGRIPYWALESIDAWWEHSAGLDWYALNVDRAIGTPFVHMTLDFSAPITPRHTLRCQVALLKLGVRSIRHSVTGFQDATQCFKGEFVSVFVDTKTFTSRRPPDDLVKIFRALQSAPIAEGKA